MESMKSESTMLAYIPSVSQPSSSLDSPLDKHIVSKHPLGQLKALLHCLPDFLLHPGFLLL